VKKILHRHYCQYKTRRKDKPKLTSHGAVSVIPSKDNLPKCRNSKQQLEYNLNPIWGIDIKEKSVKNISPVNIK
jgi:hypothetical protein